MFLVLFLADATQDAFATKTYAFSFVREEQSEDAYMAPDACTLSTVVCDGEDVGEGSRRKALDASYTERDRILAIIREEFGDEADVAIAIAKAESGLNPNAKGDTHIEFVRDGVTMGHSCGLFQIRVLPGRPDCETLKDPEYNVKYAKKMFDQSGWRPWSAFNNGSFKRFL